MRSRVNWSRWLPWLLVGLSLLLRLYNLSHAPEFVNDEGYNIETARGLLQHGTMTRWFIAAPFLDLNKPFGSYLLMAGVFKLFGVGPWQARLVSALAGVLSTYLLFLLGRAVWNSRCGLLAGLLHATAHPMLWCDRVAKEDGLGAALSLLGVYLFVLAVQRERARYGALAGLALGLALLTKLSVIFVPVGLVLAALVAVFVRVAPVKRLLGATGALIGTLLVAVAPWAAYYWHWRGLPPFTAGLAPFTPYMLPEFLNDPFSMLLTPGELGHPGALIARTTRVLTQLFVWDPVRALGLAGVLSFLISRHTLKDRGALVITMTVLVGLAAFWVVGTRLRYVHPLLLLLYLLAGVMLGRLRELTRDTLAHRFVPVFVGMLVVFGLTHSVGRLDTPNYDRYPDTWRPILSSDCGQLVDAARWLKANVPAGVKLYADSSVGALSDHDYLDLGYFANAAAVYRRWRPEYLVVTYRLRYNLAEGRGLDPFATFDLELVKRFTGPDADADVQLYRIRGLRTGQTIVRRAGQPVAL